jgi:NTP pyrophosphatase (non-canonical NTP hydrolase)
MSVGIAIWTDVCTEIGRQNKLKAAGKFEKTARDGNDVENAPVLAEEVLEVCEAVLHVMRAVNDKQPVRKELIESMAVMAQWVARIDAEDELPPYFSAGAASIDPDHVAKHV